MTKKPTEAGAMMRRHRESLGFTRHEMADLIGYSVQSVANIELGHSRPGVNYVKSFIDGTGMERQPALELMDAAGFATVKNAESKAPGVNETLPPKKKKAKKKPAEPPKFAEPTMTYQEACCFYILQQTLAGDLDDFTAQMILKIMGFTDENGDG